MLDGNSGLIVTCHLLLQVLQTSEFNSFPSVCACSFLLAWQDSSSFNQSVAKPAPMRLRLDDFLTYVAGSLRQLLWRLKAQTARLGVEVALKRAFFFAFFQASLKAGTAGPEVTRQGMAGLEGTEGTERDECGCQMQ